jgi:hypothetical protein
MADDFSTYAGRQAYRDTHPGAIVDASGAYYPTTGQTVTAGGGTPAVPQSAGVGGGVDMGALASAFNAAGTMTQKELDERKRQFDASLEWTKQMWAQQGLPQLVIQQKAAQLQQDEFAFQSEMARQQQALATAGVTGVYQGAPTMAAQQQAFQQALGLGGLQLSQQQAALDAVKTAAAMGGPENWIQAANYARGVQQTQVPEFMRNMLSGIGAPAATGGVGLSAPQTFGGVAARLGGGGTTTAPTTSDLGQTLGLAKQIFTQGGAALGPQALEGLSETEKQMLASTGTAVGADMPTFLRNYAASRIGQGAAQAA